MHDGLTFSFIATSDLEGANMSPDLRRDLEELKVRTEIMR